MRSALAAVPVHPYAQRLSRAGRQRRTARPGAHGVLVYASAHRSSAATTSAPPLTSSDPAVIVASGRRHRRRGLSADASRGGARCCRRRATHRHPCYVSLAGVGPRGSGLVASRPTSPGLGRTRRPPGRRRLVSLSEVEPTAGEDPAKRRTPPYARRGDTWSPAQTVAGAWPRREAGGRRVRGCPLERCEAGLQRRARSVWAAAVRVAAAPPPRRPAGRCRGVVAGNPPRRDRVRLLAGVDGRLLEPVRHGHVTLPPRREPSPWGRQGR